MLDELNVKFTMSQGIYFRSRISMGFRVNDSLQSSASFGKCSRGSTICIETTSFTGIYLG